MNDREMCCLLLSRLQPLSAVQCLQVVKVGQNGSQKTLRHFNSANVQVSQIWQIYILPSSQCLPLSVDPEDTSLPPPITSLSCVMLCLKSSIHNSLRAGMEVKIFTKASVLSRYIYLAQFEWGQTMPLHLDVTKANQDQFQTCQWMTALGGNILKGIHC